jgi:hypothetical protein
MAASVRVAPAVDPRPDRRVEGALQPREPGRVGRDVLEEAQLAPGPDHTAQLAQGRGRVGHAAQHRRDHAGVHRRVVGGQRVGHAIDDRDGDRRLARRLLRHRAEVLLGLDGDERGHRARVVGEAHAAAGAELDDAAAQVGQQPAAVLGPAAALLAHGGAREHAGEDRAAAHGRGHRSDRMAHWGVP